jgi:hypothetical protein
MPRKPTQPPIACEYFTWNLFQRDGVYYADARGGKHKLGTHSLGTRDRDEAIGRLKMLDLHKAIELGLAKPEGTDTYCYTREEVAAMAKHCLATPTLVWLGYVIIALAHLGVRIGELAVYAGRMSTSTTMS